MTGTYSYDAENRLIAVDGGAVTYQYDASGRRVRKTVGGGTTEYVLDLEGRVVQEYGPSLSLVRTELFAGGHVAATGSIAYYAQDGSASSAARVAIKYRGAKHFRIDVTTASGTATTIANDLGGAYIRPDGTTTSLSSSAVAGRWSPYVVGIGLLET